VFLDTLYQFNELGSTALVDCEVARECSQTLCIDTMILGSRSWRACRSRADCLRSACFNSRVSRRRPACAVVEWVFSIELNGLTLELYLVNSNGNLPLQNGGRGVYRLSLSSHNLWRVDVRRNTRRPSIVAVLGNLLGS
jgi:hypothetical protein